MYFLDVCIYFTRIFITVITGSGKIFSSFFFILICAYTIVIIVTKLILRISMIVLGRFFIPVCGFKNIYFN